jgi:hypothetical protein
MEVTNAISLSLGYMKDLILFLVSLEYAKRGETYKVRVGDDFSHLTLPEGCNGVDGEVDCCDEKFVGPLKERRLCIFNNIGYSYPW